MNEQQIKVVDAAKKLMEKAVKALADNFSKQEFLDFQLFIDGTGPGNYFEQLLEEKAMELDPTSFGPVDLEKFEDESVIG